MGNILGLHPIIHINSDGYMLSIAKSKGKNQTLNKIIQMIDNIQDEIDKIDLSSINDDSFLNISIKNNLDSYKGIVNAEIKTDSNQWNKPGAGERFLGQLLLISKILEIGGNVEAKNDTLHVWYNKKLSKKFEKPMLLNAQGTFCPPHTPPAAQSKRTFSGFLIVSNTIKCEKRLTVFLLVKKVFLTTCE